MNKMARTRRSVRPELTESWDDVHDDISDEKFTDEHSSGEYDQDDRRWRGEDMRSGRSKGQNSRDNQTKRATRSQAEPELVMPRSPNANTVNGKARTRTPHFRLNERSMTSDAGSLLGTSS